MKKTIILLLTAVLLLSLGACGASSVDLGALYTECTGLMVPMMPVEGDMRRDFLGIDPEDCAQIYTAFAEDGLLVDELWLIEAKNQEAYDRIRKLAESRIEAKCAETVNYSPEQYEVAKHGTIYDNGLYLSLVISSARDEVVRKIQAAFA